jgi:hypothetical protein
MNPVPEAMSYHDKTAALRVGRLWRSYFIVGRLQIVLRNGFERTQERAPGGCDFPPVIATHHIAGAEDVDLPYARCETPEPCAPFRTARRQNGNVPVEGGERSFAAAVTGQYLEYRYLYAH